MSDSATVLDPGRVAHASIRGYLYQAWLGVERWLELRDDEVLLCEGDEDLDRLLRDGSGGCSEQVKAYTGKINIRDEVVQETLRRFAVSHHRLRTADPPESRRFVFTSTATSKTQRLDDRLAVDVLAVWEKAKTNRKVRGQIVKALRSVLPFAKKENPRDRCRTRAQLVALLDQAYAEVARWMATSRGHRLVKRLEELDDLRGILFDKPLELPPSPRPGQLLTAAYEVIPFDETGREEILEDLARWCADDRKRLVRLIHGDGGLGKTRLLIEWCRRLAAQGWITGFLEPTLEKEEMAPLLRGMHPRLIVIDYAETRLEAVGTLFNRLAHAKDGPKARLVLLARHEGDWWQTLKTDAATEDLLESTQPRALPQILPGLDQRREVFRTAARAFGTYLKEAPPSTLTEPNLKEEAFGRPLYLHMAALAATQGQPVTRAEDALAGTLKKERRYWRTDIEARWESPTDQRELLVGVERAVTALTLLGGLSEESRLFKLAQRALPSGTREATAQELADRVTELYGAQDVVRGLEPDLFGEELVWSVLRVDPGPLHLALELADAAGHKQLLTVLTRIAQRPERTAEARAWLQDAFGTSRLDDLAESALEVAVALGDPVGTLLAQAIEAQASLELANRAQSRPRRPRMRRPGREVPRHGHDLLRPRHPGRPLSGRKGGGRVGGTVLWIAPGDVGGAGEGVRL